MVIAPLAAAPVPNAAFVRRLSVLFVVLIGVLTAITVRVWQTIDRLEDESRRVAHTLEVQQRTQSALAALGSLQTDAVVYAVSGDPTRENDFADYSLHLSDQLHGLADLTADDPQQAARVHAMAVAATARRDVLAQLIADRKRSGQVQPMPALPISPARRLAADIAASEVTTMNARRDLARVTARSTRALTVAGAALSILFLTLALWQIRRAVRRQNEHQCAIHDANLRLQAALDESRRLGESMQQLAHFGELLQSCRDMDEVRRGAQQMLPDLLPGLGGRLALLNPDQNLLAVGVHWGTHGLIAESVFPPDDCWALRRGQPYPMAGADAGFTCKHVHYPNPDFPASRYVCLPLAAQGEVIGVLTIDAMQDICPHQRRLATALSEQLALSLSNLRLQVNLREQSIRDPLTGLFNRRYLEVSLERELQRARRHRLPMAVLMLDIDHFKRFNDSHGHEAGDVLLAQFAETLRRSTRNEDIACRYGGEEFTVVLLDAGDASARQRAEAIRSAVAAMDVVHAGVRLPSVTVSIGYAVFPDDGTQPDDLLRRADEALYFAKRNGRDKAASAREAVDASST
ncbi:MAG: diguanylate cyclase [Proteobacteria bacterium]|nr:diguanylate cyclase [Pseudomonadota bacterium]